MRILVDADACPVKGIILQKAKQFDVPVIMVADTSHAGSCEGAETIMVGQGADSADMMLANLAQAGDIVVTQDHGLAALALGKGALALNQNGMLYDAQNIDALLFSRYLGKKVRRSGGRIKGPGKRTTADDTAFEKMLVKLLEA